MTFREAIGPWFDENGLIGRTPNPAPNSEGNPALETGTAYCFLKWLGEADEHDSFFFIKAMTSLHVQGEPGLFNKKPGSDELITFDDLIGICAASKAVDTIHAKLIVARAEHDGWDISNNGQHTWTSNTKPWHKAFYQLCADRKPALWDIIFLALSIVCDAFFMMEDASGKRLNYLIVKSIKGKSFICDLAILLWWFRIKRTYGSARRIFIKYHGEKHPFAQYCPD